MDLRPGQVKWFLMTEAGDQVLLEALKWCRAWAKEMGMARLPERQDRKLLGAEIKGAFALTRGARKSMSKLLHLNLVGYTIPIPKGLIKKRKFPLGLEECFLVTGLGGTVNTGTGNG
jgi:hypothetical protein